MVLFWKFLFFKKLNWIWLNCILVVVSLWLRNRFFLKRQNGWHREYQNAMRQSTSVASVLLCSSWFLEIFELKSSAAAVPCLCCFTVLFGSFTTQALKKSFFFLLNPLYYPVRAELQVHSKAVWILNNLHSSYKQYDSALICLCKVFYWNNTFPADRLIHWSKVVPAFSPPKYCMVSEYNVSNRILL